MFCFFVQRTFSTTINTRRSIEGANQDQETQPAVYSVAWLLMCCGGWIGGTFRLESQETYLAEGLLGIHLDGEAQILCPPQFNDSAFVWAASLGTRCYLHDNTSRCPPIRRTKHIPLYSPGDHKKVPPWISSFGCASALIQPLTGAKESIQLFGRGHLGDCCSVPGHALHEKGLQGQIGVGTLVSIQERRAHFVLVINRG